MLKIALLILTTMQDGSVRLTLSSVEDMVECNADRDAVVTILSSAGRAPIAAICGESALRLTPFVHGQPESAETHRYRVELFAEDRFLVTPLAASESCEPSTTEGVRVFCARSAQQVMP